MQIYFDRFPFGRQKALTVSFDDGAKQDRIFVPMLDRFGIRGTFHLNSSKLGLENYIDSKEVKKLFLHHEVSVHSVTHPFISKTPREMVLEEIIGDRKALEKLVEYPIRGMSYPYADCSNELVSLLPALGIEYARITKPRDDFSIPDDFLRWSPTTHYNYKLIEQAECFLKLDPAKSRALQLIYIWGHSYEFDQRNNWNIIEDFCKLIGKREDIWYATNIEIVDYIKAIHNLRFSASCEFVHNPTAIDVWVSVDKQVVKIPKGGTIGIF